MRSLTSRTPLKATSVLLLRMIEEKLQKKAVGPWRDPLVVVCHIPFVLFWDFRYLLGGEYSMGQSIYYSCFTMLYVSSTYYHFHTQTKETRFCDQTAIAWYILAVPLPFVTESWLLGINGVLATAAVIFKWQEAHSVELTTGHRWAIWDKVGSYCHLGLGIWSAAVMVGYVWFTWNDTSHIGFAIVVGIIILLFLNEWVIYHWQIGLCRVLKHLGWPLDAEYENRVQRVFRYTELKHLDGATSKSLYHWFCL